MSDCQYLLETLTDGLSSDYEVELWGHDFIHLIAPDGWAYRVEVSPLGYCEELDEA